VPLQTNPNTCNDCRDTSQCAEGSCCPYMKKCISKGQTCSSPTAQCKPKCSDKDCLANCTRNSASPDGLWGLPTCGLSATKTQSLGSRLTAGIWAQNVMPQSVDEALKSEDWAEVGSGSCHPKFGRRFQRKGVMTPTLMYDNTGHIAGMQFAIDTETFPLYPDSNLKAGDSAVPTGLAPSLGDYALTTYFPASGFLFPKSPGMGTHWWRMTQPNGETPCNEAGPMFLLYSRGRLVAMGMTFVGFDNRVPTAGNKRPVELGRGRLGPPGDEMWEFARQDLSPYFFHKHENPKCLANLNMFNSSIPGGTVTTGTLHVFFSDPYNITCP